MWAIVKKEMKTYFTAPVAYVLIAFFLVFASLFFWVNNIMSEFARISIVLTNLKLVLLVMIPIMTMKMFADERKNNTEVLLLTSPMSITQIVLGKYLATFLLFMMMMALTFVHAFVLFRYGDPSPVMTIGAYIAFILFGALIIALNIFIASLTENQVIAVIACFGVNLLVYLLEFIRFLFRNVFGMFLAEISPLARTEAVFRGLMPLNVLVYFVVGIALFLFFTVRSIEKKRWS